MYSVCALKWVLPRSVSPFLCSARCVSALYANSLWSSGIFCASSVNSASRAWWQETSDVKWDVNVLISWRTTVYLRWISRSESIRVSSCTSTVLLPCPSFSANDCRVLLAVLTADIRSDCTNDGIGDVNVTSRAGGRAPDNSAAVKCNHSHKHSHVHQWKWTKQTLNSTHQHQIGLTTNAASQGIEILMRTIHFLQFCWNIPWYWLKGNSSSYEIDCLTD